MTYIMFYLRTTLKPASYYKFSKCAHSYTFYCSVRFYRRKRLVTEESANNADILRYFDSSFMKSEFANLDLDLLKVKKRLPYFSYLMKEQSAKMIVDAIKNDLTCGSQYILESNPGFGFITKQLLSLGFSKVKVFEPDSYFRKVMTKIQVMNPDKLDIYDKNLYNIYKFDRENRESRKDSLRKVMDSIEPKLWSEDCSFKIIGCCPSDVYLKQLTINIVFQKGIIEYGRPQLYLILDPKSYFLLDPQNNIIKMFPTLFRIFFDVDFILILDKRDFLPWFRMKLPNYASKYVIHSDNFVLTKITPKRDLYEKIGGIGNLKPFWFFIRHLCKSSKVRVIPIIEKWLPGFGYRLLICGVDTFTEVGDLSPQKILDVFLEVISWPELKNSSFLLAMESLIEKGEGENLFSTEDGLPLDKDESASNDLELNFKEELK